MSYLDVPRDDISVWWKRLEIDDRFYKEGRNIIYLFMQEYRFLSNFHEVPILYKGIFYKTTEHAYQSAKTEDKDIAEIIRKAKKPGDARKLGQSCPIRPNWDIERDVVMKEVLCTKFSVPEMSKKLLDTGDSYLVEGTVWHDCHFGICFRKDCEKCKDKKGQNVLGSLLMELRQALRE